MAAPALSRQASFRAPEPNFDGGVDEDLFSDSSGGKAKNFKVVVRFRPLSSDEVAAGESECIDANTNSVTITKPSAGKHGDGKQHTYAYDRVYSPLESQATLYNSAIKSVVLSSLNGYNGSIIAYGQTGTGKTHSIEGDHEGEQRGIIPRAAEEIFDFVDKVRYNPTLHLFFFFPFHTSMLPHFMFIPPPVVS